MMSKKIMHLSAVVTVFAVIGGVALWTQSSSEANAVEITVHKLATCGCCDDWVKHLRKAGFKVSTHNHRDMNEIRASYGVSPTLSSCHTAIVDGYVVEGHVPAADIKRIIRERPEIAGLAAPGMPLKSPGMQPAGLPPQGYKVLAFDEKGRTSVYADYQ